MPKLPVNYETQNFINRTLLAYFQNDFYWVRINNNFRAEVIEDKYININGFQ